MSDGRVFICAGCNYSAPRTWDPAPCPHCYRRWNIRFGRVSSDRGAAIFDDGEVVSLCDVDGTESPRIKIGGAFSSIDELLSGGIVDGRGVFAVAGDYGAGKSSLLLQAMNEIAKRGRAVLYATSEETPRQIKARSQRFGKFDPRLMIVRETALSEMFAHATGHDAKMLVIDSVSTVEVSSEASGDALEPGGSMAVLTAMRAIVNFSSEEEMPIFVIMHAIKGGTISGPNSAAHLADVVMIFEGEEGAAERTLSVPRKNRFGAVGKSARFMMGETGLIPVEGVPA